MQPKNFFAFNIRQKVLAGTFAGFLTIVLLVGLSFHYLLEVQKRQHLVEIADDLSHVILEMRSL